MLALSYGRTRDIFEDYYIMRRKEVVKMEQSTLLLTGALRVFHDFHSSTGNINIAYDFNHDMFNVLREKYNIEQVAGNGDELSKVLKLLRWCCDNVLHGGGAKDIEFIPKTSIDILDYAFQKGYEYGVYCRLQSIVFSECCLALGIKSRILHCLPFNPYDFDTHVVSIVFISALNKWVLFDAGSNGYFLDENDKLLSPVEIRNKLANRDVLKCNQDIFPNGLHQTFEEKENGYKQYISKNIFYFKSMQYNTFGSDLVDNQQTIYCVPVGFDVRNREIAYCEYAIENSPPDLAEDWKKALNEFAEKTQYDFLDLNNFFA